ncbi:hypothetical protein ACMGD3_24320 [Lysinibacillus sphaericus]|uniref:hypothetical protein n=1 Tax=Lysinibacillus sphaericus TaxID=1421 RepID=UPI003F79612E
MSEIEHFTIYDFLKEETPVEETTLTKEEIEAAFNELLLLLKSNGNPYTQESFIKLDKFQKYIPSFRRLGWLVSSGNKEVVMPSLLNFHTVDEVVRIIHEYVQSLYIRIDNGETIHWYEDTWWAWDQLKPKRLTPSYEADMKISREIQVHVNNMEKDLAIYLGWTHYKEVEKSRGSKSACFKHKAYKKHFLPYFKEQVLCINNYDEMEIFLKQDFLMGRWDWWSDKHFRLPPRPNVERLCLSALEIACLAEADETNVDEIIKTVLAYSCISSKLNCSRENVVTTPTFTWEDFDNSLTESDHDYLLSDTLRVMNMYKV